MSRPNAMIVAPRARPADPGEFARFRTQMREQPEDLSQYLYDRVNYPAGGANELSFFSVPLGGSATLIRAGVAAAVNKTRRDTNLEQAGVLPTKAFRIEGFGLHYVPLQQAIAAAATPSIPDDVQRMVNGGYLELRLVDKPYLYAPLPIIADPGVLRAMVATTATATTIVAGAGPGTGALRDGLWFRVPLTVDPYQNFSVTLRWDGVVVVTQTFDLLLFMFGLMRRPGQ